MGILVRCSFKPLLEIEWIEFQASQWNYSMTFLYESS